MVKIMPAAEFSWNFNIFNCVNTYAQFTTKIRHNDVKPTVVLPVGYGWQSLTLLIIPYKMFKIKS